MANRGYKGLCLVPIKCYSKVSGEVSDIIKLDYLDSIVRYADSCNLALMYISSTNGLVCYDDYIEFERKEFPQNIVWNTILAEQIVRQCLEFSVYKVFLMNRNKQPFIKLVSVLKSRGVHIENPIQGFKGDAVVKVLDMYTGIASADNVF